MNEETTPNILQRMVAKRNEGGFTLIELLIVIIILAVLAAIVVFAVGTTTQNAVAASCNADAKSVETAMEAYKAQTGSYPSSVSAAHYAIGYAGQRRERDGGTVGSRLAPGTGHYSISIDTTGGIYILSTAGGSPNSTNNFDITPSVCNTFS